MTSVERKDIWDYVADLHQRIARLETGGRPMVGITDQGNATLELGAGVDYDDLAVTLSWNSANVTVNPKGDFIYSIYVDNDNDPNYEYPWGASLTSGQKNLLFEAFPNNTYIRNNSNKTRYTLRLKNNDGSTHTYYIHFSFVYIKGGSGSEDA